MLQPRILLQTGSYDLDNLGDQSMIASAISRIGERLPEATFSVLARSADGLQSLAPGARSVPVENQGQWRLVRSLYLRVRSTAPSVDPFLRSHFPQLFNRLLRLKARSLINREVLLQTDFMIVSGGGYFTDVFPGQAWSSLERIRAADALGLPFALVGQSFGPLSDPALRNAAAELLPRARLIALRERKVSLPLLRELGVSEERVLVTGDDTVEDAWNARADTLGSSIGVNLRVAPYAGTSDVDLEAFREGLRLVADQTQAELVSLPVCIAKSVESSSDATVADNAIAEIPGARRNALPASVKDLLARVSTCRLVVTGSYHGAVFALSQGIPTVCIHKSQYYETKFSGLKDLFSPGCELISLSSERFPEKLSAAALELWRDAPSLRPGLLHAAQEQIESGRRAYDELCAIIAAHCAGSARPHAESAA